MAYTLKVWNDFKNYQTTCYRNYLYASEGLRVMGSTWSVLAPLKGLGEDVLPDRWRAARRINGGDIP